MVLKFEQITTQKDIEVSITYPIKNKTVDRIISFMNSIDTRIECIKDDCIIMINVSDILYIESIDKKTIVFCEKENYLVKSRLYQIYEKLANSGFVQISKYCIININKLEKIKPLANSHMLAILTDGKQLYVTRKYITELMYALEENE